jgi:hypothetical protein
MIVELLRREGRHSVDSTAICLFDIRPFMKLIRLGVPEVCFLTHASSHVFQTIREVVDQRTAYNNELYVKCDGPMDKNQI